MFLEKIYKHFSREWYRIIQDILAIIPGEIGMRMREYFYKIYLGSAGAKITINMFCWLTHPQNIHIGTHSGFNRFSYLDGVGGIRIGNNVITGLSVKIITSTHNIKAINIPICDQGETYRSVIIEDDVWIGSNAVILPGVQIGKGAIVGAGAIVTKNVGQYVIVGGIPAREIGYRDGIEVKYGSDSNIKKY